MEFRQKEALRYFNAHATKPMSEDQWENFCGSNKVESRLMSGRPTYTSEALERAAALREQSSDFYCTYVDGAVYLSPTLASSWLPAWALSPQAAKKELHRALRRGDVVYRATGTGKCREGYALEPREDSLRAYLSKRYPAGRPSGTGTSSRAMAPARWPWETAR